MTHTQTVLNYITDLTWETLPAPVRHQSKRCLLDALGALIAGTRTPAAAIMEETARQEFRGDEATILVSGRRTSASGAALANGFSGNALDIDDGYRPTKGHPGACILPVLLASLELQPGTSGKTFLTGLVAGYEVGIRAGLIRHAVYPTYHSSGSWGVMAGVAAGGKLLGLDRAVLRHAFGAAEYHAPLAPMMKCIDVPSMGKDSIGWGAMTAMLNLSMARKGFTGITPLFDECPETADWIDSLGIRYKIMSLYFKPYAACRWAQPAVDGALKIQAEQDLKPEDIRTITIHTFRESAALSRTCPKDTEEAQYNIAFPVAAALLDGNVGPDQVLPPRLFDPDIRALMETIDIKTQDRFQKEFPARALSEVVITDKRGNTYTSGVMDARWDTASCLPTDSDLLGKFFWLTEPVLGETKATQLADMIMNFQDFDDAGDLIRASIR